MGDIYELKCNKCGETQELCTSGSFNYRRDHKAHLISRLTKEARCELSQLEEIYNLSDENIRVFTTIGKCGECSVLREILSFEIHLSKSFKLINSDSHYCKKCSRQTNECTLLKESCYNYCRCAKCNNLGLELINNVIYD